MKSINFKKISIENLAALVHTKFAEYGMRAVLVEGACVTIYSKNRYQSYDLDFIAYKTRGKIKAALAKLGFELQGKYFTRSDCSYFIEFVSPPIAVGEEVVQEFETLQTPYGEVKLLTPTDCFKDRLASFFHWQDRQALEQAILVYQKQKADLKENKSWTKNEKFLDKFNEFKQALNKV